jgi:hypothetical protein
VSGNLDAFLAWTERLQRSMASDRVVKVVTGDACENQSVHIVIDAPDGTTGQLTYWESASADATAYDAGGDLIDLRDAVREVGGWDDVRPPEFDRAFVPFTSLFGSEAPKS